jgi:hypothetical protein
MSKIFLSRFPEFADEPRQGDREVIAATLKAAEQELNPTLWGELF